MTIKEAIEALTHLRDLAHQNARRYEIEIEAHEDVLYGKGRRETEYHHAQERAIYLAAYADAEMRRGQ